MALLGLLIASVPASSVTGVPLLLPYPALPTDTWNSTPSPAIETTAPNSTAIKISEDAEKLVGRNRLLQQRVTSEILGDGNIEELVGRIRDASIKSGYGLDMLHDVNSTSDASNATRLTSLSHRDTFLPQLRGIMADIVDIQRSLNKTADNICEQIPCRKDGRNNEAILANGVSTATTYQSEFHDITGTMEEAVAMLQDNQGKLRATVSHITSIMTALGDQNHGKPFAAANGYLQYTAHECGLVKDFLVSRLIATEEAARKDYSGPSVQEENEAEDGEEENMDDDEGEGDDENDHDAGNDQDEHVGNPVGHRARSDAKSIMVNKITTLAAAYAPIFPLQGQAVEDPKVSHNDGVATPLVSSSNFKDRHKSTQNSSERPALPTHFGTRVEMAPGIMISKKTTLDPPGDPILPARQHDTKNSVASLKNSVATPRASSNNLKERKLSNENSREHPKMRVHFETPMEMAPGIMVSKKTTPNAPEDPIFAVRQHDTKDLAVSRKHYDKAPVVSSNNSQDRKIFKAILRKHPKSRAHFGASSEMTHGIRVGKNITPDAAEVPIFPARLHATKDPVVLRKHYDKAPVVPSNNSQDKKIFKAILRKHPKSRARFGASTEMTPGIMVSKNATPDTAEVPILLVKQHGTKDPVVSRRKEDAASVMPPRNLRGRKLPKENSSEYLKRRAHKGAKKATLGVVGVPIFSVKHQAAKNPLVTHKNGVVSPVVLSSNFKRQKIIRQNSRKRPKPRTHVGTPMEMARGTMVAKKSSLDVASEGATGALMLPLRAGSRGKTGDKEDEKSDNSANAL